MSTYRYLRTTDDQPICNYCKRVGHVVKYCRRRPLKQLPLQGKASVPVDAKMGPVFEAEIRTRMRTQTTTEPFVALCKLFRKLEDLTKELANLMKEQLGQTIEFDEAEIFKTPLTTIFKEMTSITDILLAPSHMCRSSSPLFSLPKMKEFQGMLYKCKEETAQKDQARRLVFKGGGYVRTQGSHSLQDIT